MRGQSYVILAIIFVIIVAIFAVSNVAPVEVNYLFWTGESPLILVILFSVLMGGIITATVGMVKMFRMQRAIKSLKRENEKLHAVLEEKGFDEESEQVAEETAAMNDEEN
ncbi:Uncharacterized integral membrane protein [Oceanobacillus limi]|uniref:Uncharacterized integral membrane protein n=1 Tax=Oceanobacillus limi TaxID=930131 RepID=A0A1I0H2G1_9BACI|nr:LapA family protein [Oceanobacillus limi]SET77666.1 Uncharacterized integral membrane protein [Oceanobacillus limi]